LKAYRLTLAIVVAVLLTFIPVTASSNNHFAWTNSCDTYGGFTYCLWVQYNIDCVGWQVTWFGWTSPDGGPFIGGGPLPPTPPSSGVWTQPGVYENYDYDLTLRLWITFSEYIDLNVTETFQEPPVCDSVPTPTPTQAPTCLNTNQYYMYTFQDENQPEKWQEFCYIISGNGYPSVEIQARVCSVPGFDHTYRATKMVYSGWVVKDCTGHLSYGWPAWDTLWYRSSYAK